jgi:hypothetical protein
MSNRQPSIISLGRNLRRHSASWWLPVAAALLSGLAGWAVNLSTLAAPAIWLGIILVGLLVVAMQRGQLHYPLIVLFFLPRFVYRDVWMKYRLWVGGIPMNALDVLIGLTCLSACFYLVENRHEHFDTGRRSLAIPMLGFLGVNLVAAGQGMLSGRPLYYVVQHALPAIYIVAIYFAARILIDNPAQIALIFKILLIGALLASVQQILFIIWPNLFLSPLLNRSFVKRPFDPNLLTDLPADAAINYYRTAAIPSGLAGLVFLISGMLVGSTLLNTKKSNVLMLVYGLAVILNFGRGLWLSAIFSLAALFFLSGRQEGRRESLVMRVLMVSILCVLAFIMLSALLPTPVDFVEAVSSRLEDIRQIPMALSSPDVSRDIDLESRLSILGMSIRMAREGDMLQLLLGQGHGFLEPIVQARAHGSFAFYLARTGLIGLGLLFAMMFLGMKRGLELREKEVPTSYKALGLGIAVSILSTFLSGFTGGPFSSVLGAPSWGVYFALLDIMGGDSDSNV